MVRGAFEAARYDDVVSGPVRSPSAFHCPCRQSRSRSSVRPLPSTARHHPMGIASPINGHVLCYYYCCCCCCCCYHRRRRLWWYIGAISARALRFQDECDDSSLLLPASLDPPRFSLFLVLRIYARARVNPRAVKTLRSGTFPRMRLRWCRRPMDVPMVLPSSVS